MEVLYNLNAKLTLNAGLMTLAKEHSFLCVDAQCLPVATLTVARDAFKKRSVLQHNCSNNRKKEHYFFYQSLKYHLKNVLQLVSLVSSELSKLVFGTFKM